MLHLRRILVPLDFSELADRGVEYARELARVHDARVDLLHVVEEPAFPSFYKLGAMRIYGMVPDQEKLAWTALEKRFGKSGAGRLHFHVARGTASAEVVRFAEEHEVDLVVMTSHGMTGLEHVLLGSVAEKVVRLSPSHVLVVKVLARPSGEKDGRAARARARAAA